MTTCENNSRQLMEEAIAQRSRCFLKLPQVTTGLKELDCAMLEASRRGLLLESLAKAVPGPHWVGLGVKGYFRVELQRNGFEEEAFYTFDSRIRSAAPAPAGQVRLRLVEPENLVFGQRRKSLRVEPALEHLHKAFLWRYEKETGFAIDDPALKGSDFQAGLARLTNISAGGMRLIVRAALVESRNLDMDAGQRVVVHLQFNEPRVTGTHEFWLVARVRYVTRDKVTRDLRLGIEFLASGHVDPKAGKLRWHPVQDHVVPGLTDIFFHWHLDKHRVTVG